MSPFWASADLSSHLVAASLAFFSTALVFLLSAIAAASFFFTYLEGEQGCTWAMSWQR